MTRQLGERQVLRTDCACAAAANVQMQFTRSGDIYKFLVKYIWRKRVIYDFIYRRLDRLITAKM